MNIKETFRRFLNVAYVTSYLLIVTIFCYGVYDNYTDQKRVIQENKNLETVLNDSHYIVPVATARDKGVSDYEISDQLQGLTKLNLPYDLKYQEVPQAFNWLYVWIALGALILIDIARFILVYI